MPRILPRSYFARKTLQVARGLLGKYLVRATGSEQRAGRIVEVEAYIGPDDRACHASRGRTKRTEVMFGPPGMAYVYLVYGMHHCFNIVTERSGYPAAVLIRAVQEDSRLIDGPGRVCRAFEIDRRLNGIELTSGHALWVEDRGIRVAATEVGAYPRIGVNYAGVWADRPWRLRIKGYGKERRRARSE